MGKIVPVQMYTAAIWNVWWQPLHTSLQSRSNCRSAKTYI
jgi:hypothetical protein